MAGSGHVGRLELEAPELSATIIETIPNLVVVLDRNGRIVYFNRACERVTGYRRDEALGKLVWRLLVPPEQRKAVRRVFECLRAGDFPNSYENHWLAKDGGRRLIAWSNSCLLDADGAVKYVLGTGLDITEQRAAQEALRNSEEQLRLLVEGVRDIAIFMVDRDRRIITWNTGAERIYGFSRHEIIGKPISYVYVPEDVRQGLPKRELDEAEISGWIEVEGWRRRKDGSRFWANIVRTALQDEKGRLRGFSTVTRDMTERQRVEAASREAAARTSAILNTTVDAIITIDEKAVIESFNPAAERLFGYGTEEVIGRNVSMLMPQPYKANHDRYIENYLRSGRAKIIGIGREVLGQRKDGTIFPIDLAVSEVRLGPRRIFTGIVRDITERRRMEQQILQASAAEQRRIGQDLHDGLSQHLAGIAFAMAVLERKLALKGLPEAVPAHEIAELVDQAMTQTRTLARGLYPVKLEGDGLVSALHELALNIRRMFRVSCGFEHDEQTWIRDNSVATHLYRIAQEAVNNALRHGKARRIRISLASEDAGVVLRISDDGIGFSEDAAKKDGLGLHIMKYRARIAGGVLDVRAKRGGGATVSCLLQGAASDPKDTGDGDQEE